MRTLWHLTELNYPIFFRDVLQLSWFDEGIGELLKQADPKMGPNGPCLLISMLLCNSLLLSVGRSCDVPLTSRQWDLCDYVYISMLYKILVFILLIGPLPCRLWWSKWPCCEPPCGEAHMAGTEEGIQLTAGKKLGPLVQQPTRSWILRTTMWAYQWIIIQSNLDISLQPWPGRDCSFQMRS